MIKFTWKDIEELSNEEISYLLFLEGKSLKVIGRIRGIDVKEVEGHILNCRIKYRAFEGINNTEDFIEKLKSFTKEERENYLKILDEKEKNDIEKLCIEKLYSSNRDECLFYIWILGEIKSSGALNSLTSFLKCKDGNIKRMCCSALGKIGDKRAKRALLACTYDEKPQVRQYAIFALTKLKCDDVLERLIEISRAEGEMEYVRRAALKAIEEIRGGSVE